MVWLFSLRKISIIADFSRGGKTFINVKIVISVSLRRAPKIIQLGHGLGIRSDDGHYDDFLDDIFLPHEHPQTLYLSI